MVGLRQILGDTYTNELEVFKYLLFSTIDTDWGMYSTPLPEVVDKLLQFVDIEGGVVEVRNCRCWLVQKRIDPATKALYLLPVLSIL